MKVKQVYALRLHLFGKDECGRGDKVARDRSDVVTRIAIAKAIKIAFSGDNQALYIKGKYDPIAKKIKIT